MSKIKPFEKLKFHDDFMFGLVMQDKELCREVLECLLGIKIRHLEYAEPQKDFKPLYTALTLSKKEFHAPMIFVKSKLLIP